MAQGDGVVAGTASTVGAVNHQTACRFSGGIKQQAMTAGSINRCLTCKYGVRIKRNIDIGAGNHNALYVANRVQFGAVETGHIGVNQHIAAATAINGISRRQVRAKREGVIGTGASDSVGSVGRDVVETAGACATFSRRIESRHAGRGGRIDGDGLPVGDHVAIAQNHIDGTGNAEVFDARDIVQFRGAVAEGVGVGQGVCARAVNHHIAGCQRRTKINAVVASTEVDGVITAAGGDDQVVAIATNQAVVAGATGDGVVAAGADAGHIL